MTDPLNYYDGQFQHRQATLRSCAWTCGGCVSLRRAFMAASGLDRGKLPRAEPGGRSTSRSTSAGGPPGALLPDPLPLRLALRRCGHPQLSGAGWGSAPGAAVPAVKVCREQRVTTGSPAAPAAGPVAAAAAGGRELSPAASAAQMLQQVAASAAELVVLRSASATHIQHIVACVDILYSLYDSCQASRSPALGGARPWRSAVESATGNRAQGKLLAGPAVAAAVWRRRAVLVAAAERGATGSERLLREHYDWLMTATPAGVKLHAELCTLLGTAAHALLRLAALAARWGWPRCGTAVVGLLAAGSALGGVGGGLAVLHDLLLAASGPLALQAALSGLLLRRQLAWLGTAWTLMRGKHHRNKRIGRNRSSSSSKTGRPPPPPPLVPSPSPSPLPAEVGAEAGWRGGTVTAAAAAVAGRKTSLASSLAGGRKPQQSSHHPQQQRQQPSGSAMEAAPPHPAGSAAVGQQAASLLGLRLHVCGRATSGNNSTAGGAGGGGAGERHAPAPCQQPSPLVPISRLESLLGLTTDPESGDEVVVEQLIVGVLLLVPLLALLPTSAAWHLLALAAWGATAALRGGLALAAWTLRDNVLLTLIWRGLRPLDFAGRAFLHHFLESRLHRMALVTVPFPIALSAMCPPAKAIPTDKQA
ncbi:hypothetical protein VOLCADRAFT_86618 [Volvox carteri f. nagariensis]|uniref:Uncharacterized protein n=1 Tax=Volvox carteri f. nagariensis TaxID=3068 RepID=D8TJ55_VOLCA|nr:uncharacterized protein VOLCADRAFT_86618 [Volvox carteri f. nagariensis]EFJ52480.1 hypothetical protein VOLCADRAFT_86618 [Volvox carteri f. nagariensis]|eukprot:XP_002946553.1 hypothetical protein VOLCADRAFT_86618 [Volvox carteri f. nagariensis]